MMLDNYTKIVLKSGKDQALKRFHPWIFSGAIKKMYGSVSEGDLVVVYSNKDEFLGIGHYQIGSIAIRIVSFKEVTPDFDFWKNKIESAWNLRKNLGYTENIETNVFRLIHAEGDGMPGLIIDFYNGTAVMQMHSIGMYLIREELVKVLQEVVGNKLKAVYNKSAKTLPFKSDVKSEDGYLYGEKSETEVLEYNLKFKVDWELGQKTGFFIDQRFNRELVGKYSKGKKVLNTYCYTGGFSIYALSAGATLVHSVDSSKRAIELTNRNVELLGNVENHKAFAVDAMSFLNDFEDSYDIIILDPPAFAKHKDVKHRAVQGYKRINVTALRKIAKGGILFTFSCSQVIDQRLFESTIMSAAKVANRKIRVLHHQSQPADHPYSIFHPEGRYLKGLVVYVE